jgi:hypothetical protein
VSRTGLFNIVADARTDEILGMHVVADNAGDVIYAGVLAIRFHLTVRDLADTFAPYLTMSEGSSSPRRASLAIPPKCRVARPELPGESVWIGWQWLAREAW